MVIQFWISLLILFSILNITPVGWIQSLLKLKQTNSNVVHSSFLFFFWTAETFIYLGLLLFTNRSIFHICANKLLKNVFSKFYVRFEILHRLMIEHTIVWVLFDQFCYQLVITNTQFLITDHHIQEMFITTLLYTRQRISVKSLR